MLKGFLDYPYSLSPGIPLTRLVSPYWIHVFIMAALNIGMAASVRLIFWPEKSA